MIKRYLNVWKRLKFDHMVMCKPSESLDLNAGKKLADIPLRKICI